LSGQGIDGGRNAIKYVEKSFNLSRLCVLPTLECADLLLHRPHLHFELLHLLT
jgi:hypothetical protein